MFSLGDYDVSSKEKEHEQANFLLGTEFVQQKIPRIHAGQANGKISTLKERGFLQELLCLACNSN
jgi:hypothetical protein